MAHLHSRVQPRSAVIALLFVGGLSAAAAWRGAAVDSATAWYGILPPLLAVALALVTHRVFPSLALGVVVGGLLAIVPLAPGTPAVWGRGLLRGPIYVAQAISDPTNLQILAFVVCVLVMIAILVAAGGLAGVVRRLARFARGPRSTQFITALMGLAIFIDDYANTMIVGSAMRPVSDRYRISREKLAFLVDATSAPIAGIAVISTWIGYEVGLFNEVARSLSIERSGYSMFFDALGFRFYCILMIAFVFANVLSGRDYGPMRRAQRRARTTGAVADQAARPLISPALAASEPHRAARPRARTAAIPIAALFAILLGALWYDGGGGAHLRESIWRLFDPRVWREVLGQAQNNILILAIAAAVSVFVAAACARLIARLPWGALSRAAWGGLRGSLVPLAILVLAWSLKGTCDELQTGRFLVDAVGGALSPFWFPALVFLVASLTSFATGTSWGTMAILIPTAVPIAFELDGSVYGLTTMMCLGAVLDGAIFGDHCSPISDTTIMSSISSGCDHMHHVRTQIPYSVTVGLLALTGGYLLSAAGVPSGVAILLGVAVIFAIHLVIRPTPCVA